MGLLLTKPITNKDSADGAHALLRYGCSAMQGWRTGMEDAHSCELDLEGGASFFGVFDGHGGFEVARYCAKHLHKELVAMPEYKAGDYEAALKKAFIAMDTMMATDQGIKELTQIHKSGSPGGSEAAIDDFDVRAVHPEGVGCTAVCALVIDRGQTQTLYVANAGDSRCVLCRDGQAVEMSMDHKPSLDGECKRIIEAGGFVVNGRVNGNLNLTRAIGDQDYKRDASIGPEKQIISGVPDVRTMVLTDKDEFIVLGCDGIWDCVSNQECVEFVRNGLALQIQADCPAPAEGAPVLAPHVSAVCERLLDKCLSPSAAYAVGCDNMSVTVVCLNRALPRLQQLAAQAATALASAASSSSSSAPSSSPSASTSTTTSSSSPASSSSNPMEDDDEEDSTP
jgi:protein phosphatase 1G